MSVGPSAPVAIDLYAGVGGWALGLRLAGIDVVRSYEWWDQAALTHEANNGHRVTLGDIREMPLTEFPTDVDFVVGSPPCTQFSYSNRGGSGDVRDGLRDIEKFLEVVRHVKPRAWAMENVPRVAKVLDKELAPGGLLSRFADMFDVVAVVDASEWGVPQRRRRMLAGSFNFKALESYRDKFPSITLGDVLAGIRDGRHDPVYGWPIPEITDHVLEEPLSEEELRINREQKRFHRVYNRMPFPEPLDRPSRTVTALCTRVSRESLVVQDGPTYRRLTVRERASLQSFPVAFQFLGSSHGARIKMVGNAMATSTGPSEGVSISLTCPAMSPSQRAADRLTQSGSGYRPRRPPTVLRPLRNAANSAANSTRNPPFSAPIRHRPLAPKSVAAQQVSRITATAGDPAGETP